MKNRILFIGISFSLMCSVSLFAQDKVTFNHSKWKWKENRDNFAAIFSGKTDEAIRNMKDDLNKFEDVAETYYGLCVAYYKKGQNDAGLEYFRKAQETGMPIERFMAEPRDVLKPLYKSPIFREQVKNKELISNFS